jgi:hypothetical protein
MALEDFLGRRKVKGTTTQRETDDHYVAIRVVSVAVECEGGHGTYPEMTYYAGPPERLEGQYDDLHCITITRRADGKGIDCKITPPAPHIIDTGSWTADDPGTSGGGE